MNLTEKTIDELIDVTFAKYADPREKHFFRESLRNLVRLAKAEQLQEMRMDVVKVTHGVSRKASVYASPE